MKKKWAAQVIILILMLSITIYFVLRRFDIQELEALTRTVGWRWMFIGMAAVLVFICMESLIFHIIMKAINVVHKRTHCVLYSFVGFFFSCITPSAGGGQPMQMVFMRRDGISVAVSTPILILVTITYKLTLLVFACAVLIFRPADVLAALEPVRYWCMLGFLCNVIVIAMYVLLIFRPELLRKALTKLVNLAGRWFACRRLKKLEVRVSGWGERYQQAASCFKGKKKLFFEVLFLTVLQRSILFSITYMMMVALNITKMNLLSVIILQAMICMGTDLLPLPGGTGANEAMFLLIYTAILGGDAAAAVLVFGRGIAYYGQVLLGAVGTITASLTIRQRRKNGT